MDEFLNNTPENTEPTVVEATSAVEEEGVQQAPLEEATPTEEPAAAEIPTENEFNPEIEFIPPNESPIQIPPLNPVSFTPVNPVSSYKPMSKGLKVFCLALALITALTGSCLTGYFIGKNGSSYKASKAVSLNLEDIPEKTDELSPAKVYETVNKSVVGITVYNSNGEGGQASGIVYSDSGYIVTNDHIYSEIANPKFKIHTYDGTEYDAEYVAGDLISDLAVLKIADSSLEPATFGNSDQAYMGQRVVAIGRPSDATDISSITSGIISATNRRVRNSSNYSARLIQTDSAINPGSSGGALVNMYGQVIGVTSSKLASVEYEGVGYAIPTTVMKRIVEELIKNGKVVTRAKLGITYTAINSVTAEINNYSHTGLLVDSATEDSDLYGKISKGDIITHINGTEITDDDMVLDIIEQCSAGDTITVTVVTGKNTTQTFKAQLKANIGQSSYTTQEATAQAEEDDTSGGTFNFPFGE